VEAILHAVLPYKYVDHTHADAVITLSNTPEGETRIRDLYGNRVVIIPYVMPGFDLARMVAERFPKEAHDGTLGMVLMNHGLFTFGESAQVAYERMIRLVDEAESYLRQRNAWELTPSASETDIDTLALAQLRRDISDIAGFPLVLQSHRSAAEMSFCQRDDLAEIAQRGPATPDHVIRTKRLPMLGDQLLDYVAAYQSYFETHAVESRTPVEMLDPAPRVVLDPHLGLLTLGRNSREAEIVADIYRHSLEIIQRSELLGGWRALPARAIFEVEYWELEQAKLRKPGTAPPLQGEVALITGAASGIGRACVDSLLQRGAAVVGLDRDAAVAYQHDETGAFLGIA
jgi:rhamnose utilization protein RhaD (predicted bifunctional aldolase and dehydrogenase)